MKVEILMFFLVFVPFFPFASTTKTHILKQGSSLSPPEDFLVSSPTGTFTAGFHSIGVNAFVFAIWYSMLLYNGNRTLVWIANRDQLVNGRRTTFSLSNSGNLLLRDAGKFTVWNSSTNSKSPVQLELHDSGNLCLITSDDGKKLWQSFDSPTNTLLPQQLLKEDNNLVAYRSQTNYSSGFYKLYFDNDNILRLLHEGPQITSVYWPAPWLNNWAVWRSTYYTSKIAGLDMLGSFNSSDNFYFSTWDYGMGPLRRLTLDHDGNLRVYSLNQGSQTWEVTWQVDLLPCRIHGICGENSFCTYFPESGRRCICLPGYKMKNVIDWSHGCEPNFKLPCPETNSIGFLQIDNVDFFGYDFGYHRNTTLEICRKLCLQSCDCKGFQYKFNGHRCYLKTQLFNGYQSESFVGTIYVKMLKASLGARVQEINLQCAGHVTQIDTVYKKKEPGWIKYLLWCACAVGALEMIIVLIFLFTTRWNSNVVAQGYLQFEVVGFKRFTYAELKKASRGFKEKIGQGSSGVVYKGILPDNRVAAIKCLNEAQQGEVEFLAEISIIGRLNHMNLIETWGYCAEGKHRILVYEYLELGSLSNSLHANKLDWKKRFEIAIGTAKGLAYLHEECLEWVLHCDVKPQNILLDSNFRPKLADFGLSKLYNRNLKENPRFSRIRGTRGYMAPEWVYNLPITSKVDVYSYGIVLLELITGKSPTDGTNSDEEGERTLVKWVRGRMRDSNTIEEIVDPCMNGEFEKERAQIIIKVALQCVEEDKVSRPNMSQVVHMLLSLEGYLF